MSLPLERCNRRSRQSSVYISEGGGATLFSVLDVLATFGQFFDAQPDHFGYGIKKTSAKNKLSSHLEEFVITCGQRA